MNAKLRSQMYPTISYNNRARCEKRWEDAANIYDDISDEWQISIGNGKRLNRKWRKAGGLYYVLDNNGCERCIYNENYDVEWQKAKYDRSFQPDVEAGCYDQSTLIPYHVGMDEDDDPEFYSNHQITRQYGNY